MARPVWTSFRLSSKVKALRKTSKITAVARNDASEKLQQHALRPARSKSRLSWHAEDGERHDKVDRKQLNAGEPG